MVPSLIVTLFLLLLLSITIVDGGVRIPTTLDGPFKPVTVPLDKSFRGNAVDLPDTDPLVQRNVEGFQPEQISLSLSVSHSSVWVSWITGTPYFSFSLLFVPQIQIRGHRSLSLSFLFSFWDSHPSCKLYYLFYTDLSKSRKNNIELNF